MNCAFSSHKPRRRKVHASPLRSRLGKRAQCRSDPVMGDEKYIRLDPARMGFKFVGKVPTEQQSTLLRALEALKRDMGSAWDSQLAAKEIFWLNIWQHEDDI